MVRSAVASALNRIVAEKYKLKEDLQDRERIFNYIEVRDDR